MIQSKIKICVFFFKYNDPKVKLLIDTSGNIPELSIADTDTVESLIHRFCSINRLSISAENFKIVDCQINSSGLEIYYYTILPFGQSDIGNSFMDAIDLEMTYLSNLSKTIRLL